MVLRDGLAVVGAYQGARWPQTPVSICGGRTLLVWINISTVLSLLLYRRSRRDLPVLPSALLGIIAITGASMIQTGRYWVVLPAAVARENGLLGADALV